MPFASQIGVRLAGILILAILACNSLIFLNAAAFFRRIGPSAKHNIFAMRGAVFLADELKLDARQRHTLSQ